jgi:polar amino acid transport system substrate-binding protein
MRAAFVLILIWLAVLPAAAQPALAPGGTLRAVYLETNPAHAVKDAKTGEIRGAVIDLTRELARRLGTAVALRGAPSPQSVIDAIQRGEGDIGFVAYNPERAGPVEFTQPYMLVQQTFLVREDSSISSVTHIDRTGQRIGAGKGDSVALYLGRTLKQAQLVELAGAGPGDATQMLLAGKIDAFGANRQRLTDLVRGVSGLRLLRDDLYGVEQTIIVSKGKTDALKELNQFIDDVRRSGFLRTAIERSGVIGISVAPTPSR